MALDRTQGEAFDDLEVARSYACRAPYAPAMYEFLFDLASQRAALDLGCGPGKLARVLAHRFARVDAVDPSLPMLEVARELDADQHPNINWIPGHGETAPFEPPYDLITAGASIHWMDHAVVFPRLAAAIADDGWMAVMDGDGAHLPPWADEWLEFLERWLARVGRPYDEQRQKDLESYLDWMDIEGERGFEFPFVQRVEDFVECQHSRATWAIAKMGRDLADEFDRELREVVEPYAEEGRLSYTVRTELVWGRPRTLRSQERLQPRSGAKAPALFTGFTT